MALPGFTAHVSLYPSCSRYRGTNSGPGSDTVTAAALTSSEPATEAADNPTFCQGKANGIYSHHNAKRSTCARTRTHTRFDGKPAHTSAEIGRKRTESEIVVTMPGFTAAASLYLSSTRYRTASSTTGAAERLTAADLSFCDGREDGFYVHETCNYLYECLHGYTREIPTLPGLPLVRTS